MYIQRKRFCFAQKSTYFSVQIFQNVLHHNNPFKNQFRPLTHYHHLCTNNKYTLAQFVLPFQDSVVIAQPFISTIRHNSLPLHYKFRRTKFRGEIVSSSLKRTIYRDLFSIRLHFTCFFCWSRLCVLCDVVSAPLGQPCSDSKRCFQCLFNFNRLKDIFPRKKTRLKVSNFTEHYKANKNDLDIWCRGSRPQDSTKLELHSQLTTVFNSGPIFFQNITHFLQ